MSFLQGKKTYIAAAGMALLGLLDWINGDTVSAMSKWATALGFFGIRSAIANTPNPPATPPPAAPVVGS